MTELNGRGPEDIKGGVILSGQLYHITLPQHVNKNLRGLAKFHSISPNELATQMLVNEIQNHTIRVNLGIAVCGLMATALPKR